MLQNLTSPPLPVHVSRLLLRLMKYSYPSGLGISWSSVLYYLNCFHISSQNRRHITRVLSHI